MNGEFNGRPFVAGSLTGIRAFKLGADGHLTGVSFPSTWSPDVNDAECLAYMQRVFQRIAQSMGAPPAPEHRIAGAGCTCGFYAYFKGRNTYMGAGQVAAIVEGSGVCTVGSRGFRAEKARIVALIDPGADPLPKAHAAWASYMRGLRRVVRHPIHQAVHAIPLRAAAAVRVPFKKRLAITAWLSTRCNKITTALQLLVGIVLDIALLMMVPGALGVLLGAIGNLSIAAAVQEPPSKTDPPRLSPVEFDLVRSRYPHVPVYRSRRAAVKAHPLTPPDRKRAA